MKLLVHIRPFTHRNHEWMGVFCERHLKINGALRKTGITKYSQTHRCWYTEINRENYIRITKAIQDWAAIDHTALRLFLKHKKQSPLYKPAHTNKATPASIVKQENVPPQEPIDIVNAHVLQKMEMHLKLKAYSPSTIKTYHNEMRQFLVALKNVPADTIAPGRLKNYLLYCYEKLNLSENTLHSRINALKFYYEQVLGREKFFWDIPRPKKRQLLPAFFSQNDIVSIIKATGNLKHKVMLMLAYSSGLRVSEVVNIKTKNIDTCRMVILVEQGKGKKDRLVNLSAVLLVMLREYAKTYKPDAQGYLFSGQVQGEPYSSRSLQAVLSAAKERAGIFKKGSIHALRHSFATHLLDKGTDVTIIMKLLGHNDLKTTMRYLHITNRDMLKIISPLDDLKLD